MKSRLLIGGVELKCHFNGVGVNLHDRDIQTFSFTLRSCMLLARVLAAFGNQTAELQFRWCLNSIVSNYAKSVPLLARLLLYAAHLTLCCASQ